MGETLQPSMKVRVVCRNVKCGIALILPLDRLAKAFRSPGPACPLCQHEFYSETVPDPFGPLVKAAEELAKVKDRVEIQIVASAE
jgi:hypothetical protein